VEWERHGGLTLVRIKRVIGIECKTVLLKEVEIRLVKPETPLCGSLADLLHLSLDTKYLLLTLDPAFVRPASQQGWHSCPNPTGPCRIRFK
jgi:hypothetical protein